MALDPKWKQTVDDGISNKAWDEYDTLIQTEVTNYNQQLGGTPGFFPINWMVFKAMVWVETGGPSNSAWKTRPMQIGNPGDPGYAVLKDGKEAAPLIMSSQLKQDIKAGDINQPQLNIRAGIAYALIRLVTSDMKSVDDPKDTTVREYTVVSGDSLSRIAQNNGSTVESLQKLNPTAHVLKPGQTLKIRKASIQRVITGWSAVTTANLATRYNSWDPDYKEKLDYVVSLFPNLKR
jgi:LysM repeat protein